MGCASSSTTSSSSKGTTNNNRERKLPQLIGNYKPTVHDGFVRMTSENFFGRDELVEELLSKHITSTTNPPPLLLSGKSGSGKTAVLAGLVRRVMAMAAQNQLPKTTEGHPWRIFYHFIGPLPDSTDCFSMLRRLLFELQIVKNYTDLPKRLEEAIGLVCSALSKPTQESYIVIIDSLNAIDEINNKPPPISWLPLAPAANVRIVVSSTAEADEYSLMKKAYDKWAFTDLVPLSVQGKKQIISYQLSNSSSQIALQSRDFDALLAKQGSESPLWLVMVGEEICQSAASLETSEQISAFIAKLPDTLDAILEKALERIERGPQSRISVATLCLLECSVNGLDLEELCDILVAPIQLPIDLANILASKGGLQEYEMTMEATMAQKPTLDLETWHEIERNLGAYIRLVAFNAKTRVNFFHSAFRRKVRDRYLLSTRKGDTTFQHKIISSWWHNRLANYFRSRCPDISRRCQCFPIHAHRSSDVNGLTEFLSEWPNFDTMYDEDFSRPLNISWTMVYDLAMTALRRQNKADGIKRQPKTADSDKPVSNLEIFSAMQTSYINALERTYPASGDSSKDKKNPDDPVTKAFIDRLTRVVYIFTQNGCYDAAFQIAARLVSFIDCSDDPTAAQNRQLAYAASLHLKAYVLDQDTKSVDFMAKAELPKLTMAIACYEGAIAIWSEFNPQDERIGRDYMRLAFVYSGVNLRGGIEGGLSAQDAYTTAVKQLDLAMPFYNGATDHRAQMGEWLLMRGVCETSPNDTMIDAYNKALNFVVGEYGYYHPLLERIYVNIGIYFEESGNLEKAYDLFKKWHELIILLYGPTHPEAMRATRTLHEDNYFKIAKERGDPVPDFPEQIKQDVDSDSDDD